VGQDAGIAVSLGAHQQERAGGVHLGQERGRVKGPVQQDQHARVQQGHQPPCQVRLITVAGRAHSGAEHSAGAGLGQRHDPQGGIAREAHPVADPADPVTVADGVGDLEGVQSIERHGAQPRERHARRAGLGQWPGHHLEQGFERRRAKAAAQVPPGLL
jgi:hypothetical protein